MRALSAAPCRTLRASPYIGALLFAAAIGALIAAAAAATPAATQATAAAKPVLAVAPRSLRDACTLDAVTHDWDFAQGDQGFVPIDCDASGTPVWEYGTTTYVPGAELGVWATILDADYPDDSGAGLLSPPFVVGPLTDLVEIEHYDDIEDGFDGANLAIYPYGTVWEPVGGYPAAVISASTSYYAWCVDGEPGWTGQSGGWRVDCFDLSEFTGMEIALELDFGSDASVTRPGWYVRRVRVGATLPAPQWVDLDGSPPDTPAELTIDPGASGDQSTTIELLIHGFWMEPKAGPQQIYQRIAVPGLGSVSMAQLGAPDLPLARLDLALPTDAATAELAGVEVLDEQLFPDVMVWPQPIEALNNEAGTPEVFQLDPAIYGLDIFWPDADAEASLPRRLKMRIPAVTPVLYPVRWNPTTHELQVRAHLRWEYAHAGAIQPFEPMTRDHARLADASFDNWQLVEPHFPVNQVRYEAQFLVLHPQGWNSTVKPFVDQKKARGFTVTTQVIPSPTCSAIRTAVASWYQSTPSRGDHYCLLVGKLAAIPLCSSPPLPPYFPSGVSTEDLYADVDDAVDDLDEEVYVGRIAAGTTFEAQTQIQKILDYENGNGQLATHFDDVLLVAHKEGAPGDYQGAHESVRTATYSVPPTFHTLYGSQAGVGDAGVSAAINGGMGLVAYRGHGKVGAWTTWDQAGENYDGLDIFALTNGWRTPVVWSIACLNSKLRPTASMGEVWMLQSPGGAVAHYGATDESYNDQNHELDRRLFEALYDRGLTIHAQTIEWAENRAGLAKGFDNAWMYMLLGDPEMKVRRRNPPVWISTVPSTLPLCQGDTCFVHIKLEDETHAPLSLVRVSLWKPAPVGDTGDEVLDNRYTEADGWAHIPAELATPGWLHYTLVDDLGNAVLDSIAVEGTGTGVAVAAGAPAPPLRLSARPSILAGSTRLDFGGTLAGPARLVIFDVAGRTVRVLEASAGAGGIAWDGRNGAGRPVGSGVYYARLEEAGGGNGNAHRATRTTSMLVVR